MNDRHRQILTVEGRPYMQWAVEDVLIKRIAIAQLNELNMGSQEQIAAAFRISTESVYNYIQMFAPNGSSCLLLGKQGPKRMWTSFCGGAKEVGVSCILVQIDGKNLLLDSGIRLQSP
jgi:predicted metal-dependent RNase